MKKSSIKRIFSVVLMIILLLCSTKVNAKTDSFNTTLRANESEFKREASVVVTFGLKNINIESGEKGIGSYTARIAFDPNVLEYVESKGTNKWKEPSFLNGNIAATTKDGEVVSDAQDIGSVTFKVKKDAKLGETTISLTRFSGSIVSTEIDAADENIKIKIIEDQKDDDNPNGGNSNKPNGGNTNNGSTNKPNTGNDNPGINDPGNNNPDNGNNDDSNKVPSEEPSISNEIDNSTKPGTLPKTGEINIIVPMAIVITTLSSIALFMGIKVFKGSAKH